MLHKRWVEQDGLEKQVCGVALWARLGPRPLSLEPSRLLCTCLCWGSLLPPREARTAKGQGAGFCRRQVSSGEDGCGVDPGRPSAGGKLEWNPGHLANVLSKHLVQYGSLGKSIHLLECTAPQNKHNKNNNNNPAGVCRKSTNCRSLPRNGTAEPQRSPAQSGSQLNCICSPCCKLFYHAR